MCNTVSNARYGLKFNGNLRPNTDVFNNTMTNDNVYGISLFDGGSYGPSSIGTQGSGTYSSDNKWTGTWASSRYKLLTYNSLATSSPLYVQLGSTSIFNPSGSTINQGGGNPYLATNLSLVNGTANNYSCPTVSWRSSNGSVAQPINHQSYDVKPLEEMANGTTPMPTMDLQKERLYVMQLQLYKSLLGCNSEMVQHSSVLQNFVSNPPLGFKNIVGVEEQVNKANRLVAQQLLGGF